MDPAISSTDVWLPISPKITSSPGQRSAALYRQVAEQLDVANNPRYKPRGGNTFCNVFSVDVCAAMGADLPYWVGAAGEKAPVSDQFFEANANWLCAWLGNDGPRHGWTRCTAEEAVQHAQLGQPTVVCWLNWRRVDRYHNALGSGHIAMVIPSDSPGVRIAQAGGDNFFDGDVAAGFGASRLPLLSYYWHP